MNFRKPLPIFLAIGLNLVFLANGQAVENERVVETRGEWEVVRMPPSASRPGGECVIRSTSQIKGGRRTRSEIRIKLDPLNILLVPDKELSGVMMALAVLEDRAYRKLPQRTLEHQLRIDDGKIISHEENPPQSGKWELTKNMADTQQFLAEISAGSKLIYQWKLDRSGKTHIFNLDGFSGMVEFIETSTACNAKKETGK